MDADYISPDDFAEIMGVVKDVERRLVQLRRSLEALMERQKTLQTEAQSAVNG